MNRRNLKLLAFILGIFSLTPIRFVAVFSISEVLMFLFFPYLLFRIHSIIGDRKRIRWTLLLFILWIIAAFFSDFVNESSMTQFLKGGVRQIFQFNCFLFAFWIFKKENYIELFKYFSVGTVISSFLSVYYFQNLAFDSYELSERTSYGSYVYIVLIINLFYFRKYPRFVILSNFLYATGHLFAGDGSRSSFLVGFMSTFIILFSMVYTRWSFNGEQMSQKVRKQIPFLLVLIVLSGYSSKMLYEYLVLNSYMNEEAITKYEKQANSKMGFNILSGRMEPVAAALAIADAPLFGHGTSASDEAGYMIKAAEITGAPMDEIIRYYDLRRAEGTSLIPTHSHITTAWVYHGILGMLFWMYIFIIIVKFMFKYLFVYPEYSLYLIMFCIGRIWMLWFSPTQDMVTWGIFVALIVRIMDEQDTLKKQRNVTNCINKAI